MANKVTGSTDTSGALGIGAGALSAGAKSIMIIGANDKPTVESGADEIFSISGTADAASRYGADSPVVSAVKTLIQNGVSFIKGMTYTVDDGTATQSIESCLEQTLADNTVRIILVDDVSTGTITTLKTHLAVAEGEDMFRYAVVGIEPKEDVPATQEDFTNYAKSINDSRIFIPGAEYVDTANKVVPQIVCAAGLAARMMVDTSDPALPLNGVNIIGFSGVRRAALETEKKVLGENGVTPIYIDDAGNLAIHRLVTSYVGEDHVWQEGTTRFIADYVLENVEIMLRNKYKRTKNVIRILGDIRDDVSLLLQEYDAAEIIENYDDSTLSVSKDPNDRYGALVDYEIDVVTPLYTITIKQHLKL